MRLPEGRRRAGLLAVIESALLGPDILAYDEPAARAYASLQAQARAQGRALTAEDGMIAAVCVSHGATLATRHVKDFDFLPVQLVNPWAARDR
ncbi:MAG: hypothetical protein LBR33_03425 [Propionibacteriaceae bacterium]|jgi:predicted nucleic acid-binding protein|nr:hypothetical protein [Propionibacteriaceae bacterium]